MNKGDVDFLELSPPQEEDTNKGEEVYFEFVSLASLDNKRVRNERD